MRCVRRDARGAVVPQCVIPRADERLLWRRGRASLPGRARSTSIAAGDIVSRARVGSEQVARGSDHHRPEDHDSCRPIVDVTARNDIAPRRPMRVLDSRRKTQ